MILAACCRNHREDHQSKCVVLTKRLKEDEVRRNQPARAHSEEDKCAIYIKPVASSSGVELDSCEHQFCLACIRVYQKSVPGACCPVCRAEMPTKLQLSKSSRQYLYEDVNLLKRRAAKRPNEPRRSWFTQWHNWRGYVAREWAWFYIARYVWRLKRMSLWFIFVPSWIWIFDAKFEFSEYGQNIFLPLGFLPVVHIMLYRHNANGMVACAWSTANIKWVAFCSKGSWIRSSGDTSATFQWSASCVE
jgi:hypothetical protein